MTIKSMTGFARSDGVCGETRFHWEARSVNGRGLELRLRLPPGFEGLEIKARALCQEKLNRGNCTINLTIKRETGQFELKLNESGTAPGHGHRRTRTRNRRAEACEARYTARHARRGRGRRGGGQ